jgi:hypothetical protein
MFACLTKNLCETGSINPWEQNRRKTHTDKVAEVAVLGAVANSPHLSSRQIESYSGISKTSVHRILNHHKFHPYHVSLHQELHGNDFQNHVQFCQWAQQQLQTDQTFSQNVLCTDEATFTNHGQVNTRNVHYWAAENPQWLRQVEHQCQWSINVWYSVNGNHIIGPYFIEGNLNGERYAAFLLNILPLLLEDIPLRNRMWMWYQHNGCPAHNAIVARNVLNRIYPGRWIGRGRLRTWPARSPDLTPLDFFVGNSKGHCVPGCSNIIIINGMTAQSWALASLSGFVTVRYITMWVVSPTINLVLVILIQPPETYSGEATTPENIQQRITDGCAAMNPQVTESSRQSFTQRLQLCINVNGQHFEHLL